MTVDGRSVEARVAGDEIAIDRVSLGAGSVVRVVAQSISLRQLPTISEVDGSAPPGTEVMFARLDPVEA